MMVIDYISQWDDIIIDTLLCNECRKFVVAGTTIFK